MRKSEIVEMLDTIKKENKELIERINQIIIDHNTLQNTMYDNVEKAQKLVNNILYRIEYYDRVYKKTIKYHEEQVEIIKLREQYERYLKSIKDIKSGKNTI